MYTFEYKLNLETTGSDWIKNYYTGINSEKYYVYPAGAVLYKSSTDKPALMGHHIENNLANGIAQVYFDIRDNQWILHADYPAVDPADKSAKYYWKINVIVIDKAYISEISGGTYIMDRQGIATGNNPMADDNFETTSKRGTPKERGGVLIRKANSVAEAHKTPEVELDVEGNVYLRKTTPGKSTEQFPLIYNNDNKRLEVRNRIPITFVSGIVYTPSFEGAGDWIGSFDTGIPTENYHLVMTDAYLDNKIYEEHKTESGWVLGIAHVVENNISYNPVETLSLGKTEGKTWSLSADYEGANPVCGRVTNLKGSNGLNTENCNSKYYWNFNLMAIDKHFGRNLGVFSDTLKTENSGVQGDFMQFMINRPKQ